MVKRWECQVCGYIHEGDEAPEVCPVCGADRSQFVLLREDLPTSARHTSRLPRGMPSAALHLHPILVHFPNGLMPTVWLFLGLFFLTGRASFEEGAFWLVVVVFATTPLSLASGIYNWRTCYAGMHAPIFTQKIVLTIALLLFGGVAMLLRSSLPGVWSQTIYYLCLAGMLVCVTLLGYLGGKLIFSNTAKRG